VQKVVQFPLVDLHLPVQVLAQPLQVLHLVLVLVHQRAFRHPFDIS
jgi:hypothetical protein